MIMVCSFILSRIVFGIYCLPLHIHHGISYPTMHFWIEILWQIQTAQASGLAVNMFQRLRLLTPKRNMADRQVEVESEAKGGRGTGWLKLQETPGHSPASLLLIYPSHLSTGLLMVRDYFHVVLSNTMQSYLLPSHQTHTKHIIHAEAFSTAADQTEKGQPKVLRCETTVAA